MFDKLAQLWSSRTQCSSRTDIIFFCRFRKLRHSSITCMKNRITARCASSQNPVCSILEHFWSSKIGRKRDQDDIFRKFFFDSCFWRVKTHIFCEYQKFWHKNEENSFAMILISWNRWSCVTTLCAPKQSSRWSDRAPIQSTVQVQTKHSDCDLI